MGGHGERNLGGLGVHDVLQLTTAGVARTATASTGIRTASRKPATSPHVNRGSTPGQRMDSPPSRNCRAVSTSNAGPGGDAGTQWAESEGSPCGWPCSLVSPLAPIHFLDILALYTENTAEGLDVPA